MKRRCKDLLYNRHHGESVVLIANGPSLNKMDMSLLRGKHLIGLNKIFLGFRKFAIYPRYYVAVNPYVIQQSQVEIRDLNCVKFLGSRGSNELFYNDPLTYILNTESDVGRFSTDIETGIHEGWTVTFAALQIAYYLGFKKVAIIGLDHRFTYEGEANKLNIMSGKDANHFSPDYFGYGKEWQNPDIARSEESFKIARDVYEADGREIIDMTVDGECSIFKKEGYQDYLSKWE